MLVHQAAKALEIWSEEEISVSAMYQGLGEKILSNGIFFE